MPKLYSYLTEAHGHRNINRCRLKVDVNYNISWGHSFRSMLHVCGIEHQGTTTHVNVLSNSFIHRRVVPSTISSHINQCQFLYLCTLCIVIIYNQKWQAQKYELTNISKLKPRCGKWYHSSSFIMALLKSRSGTIDELRTLKALVFSSII